MAAKFKVTPLKNGQVRFSIEEHGHENAMCVLDNNQVGNVVALLLKGARDAAPHQNPPSRAEQVNFSVIAPSGINLAPGHKPGFETLLLSFGAANVGFAIPHEALGTFGQRMLTLSAGGERQ
jgi:hypothetical protein